MRIKIHFVENGVGLPQFRHEITYLFAIVKDGESAGSVAYNTFLVWTQDCNVSENDYDFWYEIA